MPDERAWVLWGRASSDDWRTLHGADDPALGLGWTSPEGLSHFGVQGPVVPGRIWLQALCLGEDLERVWWLTDPSLRMVWIGDWLELQRDLPAERHRLVADLSLDYPEPSDLWAAFVAEETRATLDELPADAYRWPASAGPQPVTPGRELVTFVDPEGAAAHTLKVLMRHTTKGWLVAGFE